MQYTRPSFSAGVSNGSISDTAYEVAVGARCATCLQLTARRETYTVDYGVFGKSRQTHTTRSRCKCPKES